MKRSTLIITGLCAFLVFALIKLPASVAYPILKDQLNGAQLSGLSGTLWSGQANTLKIGQFSFKNAHWQMRPLALLTAKLGLELDIRDAQHPLEASVDSGFGGSIEARHVRGSIPAAMLQQIPMLALVQLDGDLQLDLDHLKLDQQELVSAQGEVLLEQAVLKQPLQTRIGTIQFTVTEHNQQVMVKIKDRQAPIAIDGELSLQAGRKFNFKAKLKPGANADNLLLTMLKNISRIEPDGSMNIRYQGAY